MPQGHRGVKPDIPFGSRLDNPNVFRVRTSVFGFGTVLFPIGAALHEVIAGMVIAIGLYPQFFLA